MQAHSPFRPFARLTSLLIAALLLAACGGESGQNAPDQVVAPASSGNALPAGVSLIETVEAQPGELVIPYRKYTLDNGLTVILHEDHSDPLVRVDVTYHVGSAREEPRRSGFAHFFEHMMFQGSEHVADEEHIRIVSEVGGTMNGTTNTDRTNYFETVPSNQLETMLWLESDRMGFLLDAVTEEKFETQRSTVKNERGVNYDNSPYGLWREINAAALYPPDHPYSWLTIGYTEDLDAATLDDLKNFFLRWYGPNNATLSIGGNIEVIPTLELVVKYFGEIPRGPAVEPDTRAPVELDADRYVSYVDQNIRFPALLMTWPTVPLDHPDRVALEALNQILGEGRKSYLYKEFVLTSKAIASSGFINNQELAGEMTLFIQPYPGSSMSQLESELRALLADFGPESISDDDLAIYKAQQEMGLVNLLTSVSSKVSQLAYYETFLGNPDYLRNEIEAVRNLTKEDVVHVFNTYIKDKPAVIQSVVPPSETDNLAEPDNFDLPSRPVRLSSATDELEMRRVVSSFDRSVRPTAGSTPSISVPEFWRTTLDNGVEIIGTTSTEAPLVILSLSFTGGHLVETPDQYGLASLTASMMNEGTENYSAEEYEIALAKLGSAVGVGSGTDTFSFNMRSLERQLDPTLDLLQERLQRSAFTQEDLTRLRQQQVEALQEQREDPGSIANNVYREMLYGEGTPLSVSGAGTPDSVAALELDDVESFNDGVLASRSLKVVVVSPLPRQEILDKLAFLGELPDREIVLPEQPPAPETGETTVYFIDKPDAPQSEIRIGYMTDLPFDATGEYFERMLMNYPLGGAFNSRINLNLREEHGYTYGASSGFSGSQRPGPFTASASVRNDSTADAIVQFMTEITEYRDNGITLEELQFTRDAIAQSEALDYETPNQKAGLLRQVITFDLPADFTSQQQDIIASISTGRINELAREYLPVESMYILVVGDRAMNFEAVQALGYPVVELDIDGNPID